MGLFSSLFRRKAKTTRDPGATLGSGASQFQTLPLIKRRFITDSEGELWCIEIRKCSQTGTVLKGKFRVVGKHG